MYKIVMIITSNSWTQKLTPAAKLAGDNRDEEARTHNQSYNQIETRSEKLYK